MTNDFHLHLAYSACASPEMTVANILRRSSQEGLNQLGLVLHLHPHTQRQDFTRARAEMGNGSTAAGKQILLGAEAELLDQGGRSTLGLAQMLEVDYVMLAMGHFHLPWVEADLGQPSASFLAKEAEALLRALEGTRVDVVAHPFIYSTLYKLAPGLAGHLRPHAIPQNLLEALACRLVEGPTALEFHCRELTERPERVGGQAFVDSYFTMLSFFRNAGVSFVPGSDAHYLDQIGRTRHAPAWAQGGLPLKKSDLS